MTNTTTASKYIPKRTRICINWNLPFQTQIYLGKVKVPPNVNIVKQDLLNKKQILKIVWSEVWKGGFQLIQILGLLGYVLWCCGSGSQDFFTFIQIGFGHTVLWNLVKVAERSSQWIFCKACAERWNGSAGTVGRFENPMGWRGRVVVYWAYSTPSDWNS